MSISHIVPGDLDADVGADVVDGTQLTVDGHSTSETSLAAAPIYQQGGVPVFSGSRQIRQARA